MSKKEKNLKKHTVKLIIAVIATIAFFIIICNVHSTSCCAGLVECPLYKCSKESDSLILFYVLGFLLFFSVTSVALELKNVLKRL